MTNYLIDLLNDPNVRYVTLGCVLLGISSAVVGCFTLLRKRALVGDAVAHAVLPGVCLAFVLAGNKNPLALLAGAFATGWLSVLTIDALRRHTKLKEDTAIGLVLSVFFGVGILLLTAIQHSGNPEQAGLDKFLFGQAASLVGTDLQVFGAVAVGVLITVALFYKELKILSFDPAFAAAMGLPVRRLEWLLSTLTVLAVVTGIQAVGVVLMAALLITPAAAARYWTERLGVMIGLAALFGGLSGLAGAAISYAAPAMPTGPWVVVVVSGVAIASFLLAPRRGVIARWYQQRQHRRLMAEENILKGFFHLAENAGSGVVSPSEATLQAYRHFAPQQLRTGLRALQRRGFVVLRGAQWTLTPAGTDRARRIVKLHRLLEMYLARFLRLPPDHVHEAAETLEHLISPELEARLEEELDFPTHDPHDRPIPYA